MCERKTVNFFPASISILIALFFGGGGRLQDASAVAFNILNPTLILTSWVR